MTTQEALGIALFLMAAGLPKIASAQDAASCKEGYEHSQVSRDAGELLEARRLLQQCSNAACSSFVQKECVGWLSDVEARLPSVILSAKDGAGADLVDVAVSIDGREGPRRLDGRTIDIDPGEHVFVFELADGTKAEQRVFLRERDKERPIAVTLGAPPPPPAPIVPPPDVAPPPVEPPPPPTAGPNTLKMIGYAGAGAGVVGIVIGTIFGLKASSKLSSPQCDTTAKVCDPGVIDDASSAATVSTVGFVAGGILLAGGVTLVILAPRIDRANRTRMALGWSGRELSLHGEW